MIEVALHADCVEEETESLAPIMPMQSLMPSVELEAASPPRPGSPLPAVPVQHTPDAPKTAAAVPTRAALDAEQTRLADKANRAARVSTEITLEMIADVQELLRLFGIPYVVSPSEAEAQCATLEQLGLTQGTITDDNDVFLFGGRRVLRHVCSRHRAAQQYSMPDIERTLRALRTPASLV